jgi:lipopolysaccharide biosynthesis glycosyltransferase
MRSAATSFCLLQVCSVTSLRLSTTGATVQEAPNVQVPLVFSACGEKYCHLFIDMLQTVTAQHILDDAGDLVVHVLADDACRPILDKDGRLARVKQRGVSLFIHPSEDIAHLPGGNVKLFAKCASNRLLVPQLLGQYLTDGFLYMDTDALVLGSLLPIMRAMQSARNQSQQDKTKQSKYALFLAEEIRHVNCYKCGWYNSGEKDRDKYKGHVNGFNSGVMGVNLRAWRAAGLDAQILEAIRDAVNGRAHYPLGDQDILNLIVQRHPEFMWVLPCQFNMRGCTQCHDHCTKRQPHVIHMAEIAGRKQIVATARDIIQSGITSNGGKALYELAGVHVDQFKIKSCVDANATDSGDEGPIDSL